ncbi:DEKNAAC103339 [Brettanomyces naardenensis]|uniref:DEKNAAC103339 n=1 Tax=Brettanomyces naardenensis TaxID=13370 RepID=A0A448YNY1_BRENA|nr:DEKNAAC103339 [Brettanomyces naardenensis]
MNPNQEPFLGFSNPGQQSRQSQQGQPPQSLAKQTQQTQAQQLQSLQSQSIQSAQDLQPTVQTTGSKPRTIHVAHRRSPSELTTLMLEQLNLQRQLEIVQAQQQQILQQQQQLSQQAGMPSPTGQATLGMQSLSLSPTPPSSASGNPHHRRSSSSNTLGSDTDPSAYSPRFHRRTQSSMSSYQHPAGKPDARPQALGHSRRHSLGLAEARRAAAEVQAQRTHSPSKLGPLPAQQQTPPYVPPPALTVTPSLAPPPPGLAPPSFKFPPSPQLETAEPVTDSVRGSRYAQSAALLGTSPQRTFQFPPREGALTPPVPAFVDHRRGSSGHRSTNSESGNWRRQQQQQSEGSISLFTLGHNRKQGSYGGSTSSISQFQNGQRKSLFAPYLPQNSLPELIAEGRLVTGILRVNKKNRSDAYVSTDGLLDSDIFICGSKDRNRALEGDLVAVELLIVDEVWSSKREKEEKKRRKDKVVGGSGSIGSSGSSTGAGPGVGANSSGRGSSSNDVHNDASTSSKNDSGALNRRGSLKQRPTQKKNDDVEVEGQSLLLVEEEQISDDQRPLYAGHIVAVIDRIPGQLFSGTLGLLRPSQASKDGKKGKDNNNGNSNYSHSRPKIVWFKPTDKKVPLIAIPTEQAPRDFVENHESYGDQIFVASIKRWPITSLHPFGTLVSQLGSIDDPQVEVTSILRDNNFQGDEYPEKPAERYLSDLPSVEEGLHGRRDLTGEYVLAFSKDGKVSDHAMHVKVVSSTRIELGVHIADVTYFVRRDSSLDKRARKRSHGVALPQQTVGLFPDSVAETVSFKANDTCLALSVIFEIDSASFEVADVWMGETVVRPAQKVDYDTVDSLLAVEESSGTNASDSTSDTAGDSATAGYVATLSLIAARLRKKRLGNPDLDTTVSTPLFDQLDDERVRPTLNIYDTERAAALVAEIFHAVNAAVAQKVHSGLGSRALLRRYAMPSLAKFEAHMAKIARLGVHLDTTSAATFHNSLLSVTDPVKRAAAETVLVKCMPRGRYIVAGHSDQSFGHYLFNTPSYTHFTSPLRRYADLVVHRQLKAVVSGSVEQYPETEESLKVTCDYCNFKKDCARAAQEQAVHLLLCQTVNDMGRESGQVLCTGVVLQVYESSFDVYLPEFGIEKRVHGDQLPVRKAEFNKAERVLELYWEVGVDAATYVPEDENDALSYRSSIRNKFRAPVAQAAQHQAETAELLSPQMAKRLSSMHLREPVLSLAPGEGDDKGSLGAYLKFCATRVEGDDHIQEIRVLQRVPVLLRAEIGMALPCLTVRTVNPF